MCLTCEHNVRAISETVKKIRGSSAGEPSIDNRQVAGSKPALGTKPESVKGKPADSKSATRGSTPRSGANTDRDGEMVTQRPLTPPSLGSNPSPGANVVIDAKESLAMIDPICPLCNKAKPVLHGSIWIEKGTQACKACVQSARYHAKKKEGEDKGVTPVAEKKKVKQTTPAINKVTEDTILYNVRVEHGISVIVLPSISIGRLTQMLNDLNMSITMERTG